MTPINILLELQQFHDVVRDARQRSICATTSDRMMDNTSGRVRRVFPILLDTFHVALDNVQSWVTNPEDIQLIHTQENWWDACNFGCVQWNGFVSCANTCHEHLFKWFRMQNKKRLLNDKCLPGCSEYGTRIRCPWTSCGTIKKRSSKYWATNKKVNVDAMTDR